MPRSLGKSTTLAAMIDHIHRTRAGHIRGDAAYLTAPAVPTSPALSSAPSAGMRRATPRVRSGLDLPMQAEVVIDLAILQ